jgi:hypothetical protein
MFNEHARGRASVVKATTLSSSQPLAHQPCLPFS